MCIFPKFLHFASQNSISVIGPGFFPASRSLSHSMLRTSSTSRRKIQFHYKIKLHKNLVSPFYYDAFNIVFHQHINLFSVAFSHSSLLIVNVTCSSLDKPSMMYQENCFISPAYLSLLEQEISSNLGKRKKCFSFYMSSDLIYSCSEFVDLSSHICES